MDDCIFCKIAGGEIPSQKLYDDGEIFCVKDINPASPTHLLVIPYKHVETLMDLEKDDLPLVGRIFGVVQEMAKKYRIDAEGFRVLHNVREWGGQRVFHIHFHILGGRKYEEGL